MIDYVFEINTFGKLAGVYILWCDFNHVLLGVTLFLIIKKVYIRFLRENACLGSILNVTDKYSYKGYLVHQFLILGPMSMIQLTGNLYVNIVIILLVIFLICVLLKKTIDFFKKGKICK